ncbi:MAG: hypothetical protein ACR2L2_02450 [Acidobacteriota bacterium]
MSIADWEIEDCIWDCQFGRDSSDLMSANYRQLNSQSINKILNSSIRNPQYNPQFSNPQSPINSAIPNPQSKIQSPISNPQSPILQLAEPSQAAAGDCVRAIYCTATAVSCARLSAHPDERLLPLI